MSTGGIEQKIGKQKNKHKYLWDLSDMINIVSEIPGAKMNLANDAGRTD